jgi:hypothetical protein
MLIYGIIIVSFAVIFLIYLLIIGIRSREFSDDIFWWSSNLFLLGVGIFCIISAVTIHSYTVIGYVDNQSYVYEDTTYIVKADNKIILLRDDGQIVKLKWDKDMEDFDYQIGDSFSCNGNQMSKWGSYTKDKIVKKISD